MKCRCGRLQKNRWIATLLKKPSASALSHNPPRWNPPFARPISRGGDNSTILLADSARMAFTKDSKYLYLHLFTGEQFENLREQRSLDRNVPFRRESFVDKEVLIPFDANFNHSSVSLRNAMSTFLPELSAECRSEKRKPRQR